MVNEAPVEDSPLLLPGWITNPFGQRATEDVDQDSVEEDSVENLNQEIIDKSEKKTLGNFKT